LLAIQGVGRAGHAGACGVGVVAVVADRADGGWIADQTIRRTWQTSQVSRVYGLSLRQLAVVWIGETQILGHLCSAVGAVEAIAVGWALAEQTCRVTVHASHICEVEVLAGCAGDRVRYRFVPMIEVFVRRCCDAITSRSSTTCCTSSSG
jgi:hypothetical protein